MKVRENRLRRTAPYQGYNLVKSRARDPRAPHFYAIIDSRTGDAVNALRYARWPCSWDPDFVEGWLTGAPTLRSCGKSSPAMFSVPIIAAVQGREP